MVKQIFKLNLQLSHVEESLYSKRMAQIEVILPKMGESVAEATITKWLKAVGDTIESEESIVEIATDKVDSEIPAPQKGIISKILVQEGEIAKVGQVIALISSEATGNNHDTFVTISPKTNTEEKVRVESIPSSASVITATITKNSGNKFYSPLVRNIAKQEGVSSVELESINGSGLGGRVTKQDILNYIPNRNKVFSNGEVLNHAIKQNNSPVQETVAVKPATSYSGNVEIIEMDRMRKLIADHMVNSKKTAPHVTSFVEADVTNMVMWREKNKKRFEDREGEKITFTPLFVEIVVKALHDFPMVNVSVSGTTILKKKYINIGIATALPSGNLIVPVIKNADQMNLTGLTKSVNSLVSKARTNSLKPDEIQDGTFTITNVGTFGNLSGTPIINQPQVAILATGAIKKKPAVIETPEGDFIGIRHMMYLSLSYDHRVVDGALGGSFLRKIADYLEQFDINRSI